MHIAYDIIVRNAGSDKQSESYNYNSDLYSAARQQSTYGGRLMLNLI